MEIRNIKSTDYQLVITNLNEWWGGRKMSDMLPKLFFDHFPSTSFIITKGDEVLAFLVGFISQKNKKEAYVHFIGVNPKYRKQGLAKSLYQFFFKVVAAKEITSVTCVTSLQNEVSIAFHQQMGFLIKLGDKKNEEGIDYFSDYDGLGEDRVVFSINI
jgi:ribosomal protein S18 acetylase RimI-like enzyme